MSPQELQSKHGRHIASDVEDPAPQTSVAAETVAEPAPAAPAEPAAPAAPVTTVAEASKTPKVDQLVTTLTIPARQNPVNLNGDMLKEEITALLSRVDTAEEYESASSTSAQIDNHKSAVSASLISLIQVERSLGDLLNPADAEELRARIAEAKIKLEASLVDLEANQVALAARPAAPAAPAQPAAPASPAEPAAPAAPSVAAAEPAAPERAPSVVAAETRPDPEATKDPILCALEEQNKLLREQLQTFMSQQSQITQQLMSMTQMMMMQSMQNMYRTPDTFNYNQAYQYHQPQVAGNWVYYPNGMQPIQPGQTVPGQQSQANIFGLNQPQQQPQMPSPYMMPFPQPQMMNQGGQWGLAPQTSFTPGNFGMDAFSFNFSQGPQVPMAPPTGQFI